MKPIQELESLLTSSKVVKSTEQTTYLIKETELKEAYDAIESGDYLLKKGNTYILLSSAGETKVYIAGEDEPYDSAKALEGGSEEGVTQEDLDEAISAITLGDLGATSVGESLVTATDASNARTAIGAGTSNLELGTSSTTALRGDTPIPSGRDLVPTGGTDGQVLKITGGAPAWGTDANTTYSVMTQAEFDTGTASTARAVSASSLNRDIQSKIVDYLLSLPNAEAGNVLTVNSTEDGFEWTTPSV